MSLYPTFREYQDSQTPDQLGIIGNEITQIFCSKCKKIGDESMKRLNCGHCLHKKCFVSMYENSQYRCEIDQEAICPGYLTAMGK